MVFILSALWWVRTRGLWKLPDGRDWLRGKLGLVLIRWWGDITQYMFNPIFCWWVGCVPSLLFTWGQTMVEVMKIMETSFKGPMRAVLHSMPPTLHQATSDPGLCWRLLDTPGLVWVSLLWGHCSFLLGPDEHKVLFVPSKSLFLQSHMSSGSSVVGLMVTSSKRAYAIPRCTAPKASAPMAVHCWPVPPETLKHSSVSVSVGSLGPGRARFVWALWASLAGMGFDSKHSSSLLPSCWGFSFALGCGASLQSCPSTTLPPLQRLPPCWGFSALEHGVSPQSRSSLGSRCSRTYRLAGASLPMDVKLINTSITLHSYFIFFMVGTFKIQSFSSFEVYAVLSIQFSVVLMLFWYQIIRDSTFRSFNDR